jgi:antitoxin component YwqK of YwqJK toxin-antitoxin module
MKGLTILILTLFMFVNVYAEGNDTIIQNGNKLEYTKTYENGEIQTKGTYTLSKKRTGKWVSYHHNGKISSIAYFKDDKKHGTFEHYNENGELVALITYKKNHMKSYYAVNKNGGLIYKNKFNKV